MYLAQASRCSLVDVRKNFYQSGRCGNNVKKTYEIQRERERELFCNDDRRAQNMTIL